MTRPLRTGPGEQPVSRRRFLSRTALTAATVTIVPRHILGGPGFTPPSEKLNIAGVGIGGMGASNLRACEGENIAALCDVDAAYAAKTIKKYPQARVHRDFRKMLDEQKDIDAVIVATPDHTHAVVAMAAMSLGKHVYVQKPLTHSIYEARKLTEAAKKLKVATQMGNQGHSMEGIRLICEWIWDGAIGTVREVHCWTDRPAAWWPQGVDRPKDAPAVPATLEWDLWLGPARERPYHPAYLPFKWRGWWDFGTGALGDMGCHIFDAPFWALKLGYPTTVEASFTPVNAETAPLAATVHYTFPEREGRPEVRLTWYDGGLRPRRPPELEDGRPMGNKNGGILFVGEKGTILASDENAQDPRLIPETRMREYKQPAKTIPRVQGTHEQDWIRACKGGTPAGSNFEYAGPLSEVVLLGNLAIRTGQKLHWDGPNMKATNVPDAEQYIRGEHRKGWEV